MDTGLGEGVKWAESAQCNVCQNQRSYRTYKGAVSTVLQIKVTVFVFFMMIFAWLRHGPIVSHILLNDIVVYGTR